MNQKHLVLTMSFLGLWCLNSKNIAVPSHEGQDKKQKIILLMRKKVFLLFQFQHLKRKTRSIALNQPTWKALIKFLVRFYVLSSCVRAFTKFLLALTKQAHSKVWPDCQKGCCGLQAGRLVCWFVFLKFLSIINWLDQEAIAFGWFYT